MAWIDLDVEARAIVMDETKLKETEEQYKNYLSKIHKVVEGEWKARLRTTTDDCKKMMIQSIESKMKDTKAAEKNVEEEQKTINKVR